MDFNQLDLVGGLDEEKQSALVFHLILLRLVFDVSNSPGKTRKTGETGHQRCS